MLTTTYYLHCLLTVAAAVCFADLLVHDGMLLAPAQRWLRAWYARRYTNEVLGQYGELDTRMWWKPFWGCARCVAGQWAFWAYLCHYHGAAYSFPEHIYFISLALVFSLLLQWLIRRLS